MEGSQQSHPSGPSGQGGSIGTVLSRITAPLAFSLTVGALLVSPLQAQQSSARAHADIRVNGATVSDVQTAGILPGAVPWLSLAELPGVKIQYLLADQHDMNPYTYRLKFPAAGYELESHTNKTHRYVSVLEGTYVVGFGDTADRAKAVAFPAGSYVWLPKLIPHFAWTEGETVIQVHGNGANEVRWRHRG